MNAIAASISAINTIIQAALPIENVLFYGNTELVTANDQTFPRCLANRSASGAILPDRAKPLKIYHRVNGITKSEPDDESFGRNTDEIYTAEISLFGIGDQIALSKELEDVNETLGMMVMDSIPNIQIPAANLPANLSYAIMGDADLNENKTEILESELSGVDLTHKLPKLIAFQIDYSIEARSCSGVCT
jgi:hypothetical protein